MDQIHIEIRANINLYSPAYQSDVLELLRSIQANKNTKAVLEQMADNIPNYTQEDATALLSLVQSYKKELYINELIGLNQFGFLAKHKNVLCFIQAQCTQKLNTNVDLPVTGEAEITKKSRSFKNTPVKKKRNLEANDHLASDIQEEINTIAFARILGDLTQKNVPTDVSPQTLNKAKNKWFAAFYARLKQAIEARNEELLNRLWQANFNDNFAHFKAHEIDVHTTIIEKLKKDNIDTENIEWFNKQYRKQLNKKEINPTLKSKNVKPAQGTPPIEKPTINPLAQGISHILTRLNNTLVPDAIMVILEEISLLTQTNDLLTLKEADVITIKFEIDETIRRIYQNCILGVYGNNEQRIQIDIFDTCTDRLIAFGTQLRIQHKVSVKEIDTYVNDANKLKQACLYNIKVIRDTEKIAVTDDIARWKTIIKDKLASQLEGQDAAGIQKTIHANFDAHKNPQLAEEYENIVPSIYNQKNKGDTWPVWLANNKKYFEQPTLKGQPGNIPVPLIPCNKIYQACKDYWMLGSLALTVVVAGLYYAWEEWDAQDEDEDQAASQKESEKKTAKKDPSE